jgi:hypothetical protein
MKKRALRWGVVACSLVLGALAARVASADGGSTRLTGKSVSAVVSVSGPGPDSTAQTTWADLPDAVVTVKVPGAWSSALLDIRLSADFVFAIPTGARAQIRVLVDGAEVAPGPLHIDRSAGYAYNPSLQSLERTASVGPGSHTVQLQAEVCDCGTALSMTDWTLTVERARSS